MILKQMDISTETSIMEIIEALSHVDVLDCINEDDIQSYCERNGIEIEIEVEVEVEIEKEVPEIEIPLSGPPQNLFEELCHKFDLPRAATSKEQLINHIKALL